MSPIPADHALCLPGSFSQGRLIFRWRHDRFQQLLLLDASDPDSVVCRSIEGTPQEDWPASPAIQQISTEAIDGIPTVLGVGCSGTSHHSYSVQALPLEQGGCDIHVQCAARLSKPLVASESLPDRWLGSRYKITATHEILVVTSDNARDVSPAAEPRQRWIEPQTKLELRTVAWSYRIRLLS